jgi:hypothetical protein
MSSNFNEIVRTFLEMKNYIELYHWQTTSYSRHKATDKLKSKLIELIDSFVEVYIGTYGSRPNLSNKEIKFPSTINDENMIKYLIKCSEFLNKLKLKNSKPSTHIYNIRDEMLDLIYRTLYLFTLD